MVACLFTLMCGAPSAAAADTPQRDALSEPQREREIQAEQPDDAQASHVVEIIAVKVSLLAAVGIILVLLPGTNMSLFENGKDIFLTCIVAAILAMLLLYDSLLHPLPFINRVVGLSILIALLIPYSLIANDGKIWTLLVVIPGKIAVLALIAVCGIFLFFISIIGAGSRLGAAKLLWIPMSYILGKFILSTTRAYRDE